MTLGMALILMLISLVVALYLSLVLVTFSKAEDMNFKVSFLTAFVLPGLILFSHIRKYIHLKYVGDGKGAEAVLKVGILKYPVGLTVLFTVIQHHTIEVRETGRSPISSEVEGTRKQGKQWGDSLPTLKKVLSLDFFNDSLQYT